MKEAIDPEGICLHPDFLKVIMGWLDQVGMFYVGQV